MLKFNDNGQFKILLFGDIHEQPDYKTNPAFKDMQKLMIAALEKYSPDLCVFLGDNCENISKESREDFRDMFLAVSEPIRTRKIPLAIVLGNHEHDAENGDEVAEICASIEGCIIRDDAPETSGKADYKELIYSADGKTPKFCLWFLDSNNLCSDKNLGVYDYVHSDQIEWFEKESAKLKELNGGTPMPSLIFQHIPVPEEYDLMRKAKFWEIPRCVRGFNSKSGNLYVLKDGAGGYLGEGPCSPDFNNGQFAAWKRAGGVLGAFFGHDHLNDFSGFVEGIFLAQHKTGGFRAYTDGCRSAVRCVTLYENNPLAFTQELKHFKEFGLVSESLGPIFKRVSDRQSLIMHICANLAGGAAIAAGASLAAYQIIKTFRR